MPKFNFEPARQAHHAFNKILPSTLSGSAPSSIPTLTSTNNSPEQFTVTKTKQNVIIDEDSRLFAPDIFGIGVGTINKLLEESAEINIDGICFEQENTLKDVPIDKKDLSPDVEFKSCDNNSLLITPAPKNVSLFLMRMIHWLIKVLNRPQNSWRKAWNDLLKEHVKKEKTNYDSFKVLIDVNDGKPYDFTIISILTQSDFNFNKILEEHVDEWTKIIDLNNWNFSYELRRSNQGIQNKFYNFCLARLINPSNLAMAFNKNPKKKYKEKMLAEENKRSDVRLQLGSGHLQNINTWWDLLISHLVKENYIQIDSENNYVANVTKMK